MKKTPVTFEFDMVIVGGGAAGLAAAIRAGYSVRTGFPEKSDSADSVLRVALIEKKEVPGKKLSATGNGRCNLSNSACTDREDVDSFFDCLGLMTRTDEAGRMYPYSEEAGEVSALLTETARKLNTEIFVNCQVSRVESVISDETSGMPDGFLVKTSGPKGNFAIRCRKLLLAMGGKSYSVFGTTGDGYGIARRLGHSVTRLAPSLVPVNVVQDVSVLAGVRTKARVSLYRCGKLVSEETGEVQFNKDCLSGICIMNLSRLLVLNTEKSFEEAFAEYELVLDLVPELSEEELACLLEKKNGAAMLQTLVKKKLSAYLFEKAGVGADSMKIASLLKHLTFKVSGTKGWNDAQVTRGGVELTEVNRETMESLKVPGLYFAGEILDYDGPCGGYNLHFAWESGLRAGRAMAESLLKGNSSGTCLSEDGPLDPKEK